MDTADYPRLSRFLHKNNIIESQDGESLVYILKSTHLT